MRRGSPGASVVERDGEDLRDEVEVAVRVPGGDDGQARPVRGERECAVLEVAGCELSGLRGGRRRLGRRPTDGWRGRVVRLAGWRRHRHEEHVRPTVDRVADPVGPEVEGRDAASRLRGGTEQLDRAVSAALWHPRDEGDRRGVRRPLVGGDAERLVGDLHRLAAGGIHHEDLGRSVADHSEEGEQRPVRREPWVRVADAPAGAAGCAAVEGHAPELADVTVGSEVGPRHCDHGT